MVALAVATCFVFGSAASAEAQTRSLKLYFIHTKERAEITYMRNGRYVQSGLNEINRFLRDWRRNEPATMDPKLLDLVWEVYRSVGAKDYIHVVSAYRSPATNKALRSRSSGVAEKSQHMLGKAMDFYIPGVPLNRLRAAAFKAHGGGVGYYPKSGAPFVHLDVGNVRSWPRMNRNELMALFPDGKTIHIPTDGKPLAGFNQALAEYKAKGRVGSRNVQMAAAQPEEKRQGFFARLFGAGGGADDEEDSADSAGVQVAAAAPRAAVRPQAPVAANSGALPGVAPAAPLAAAPVEPEPETPETIIASLRSAPLPSIAPRPAAVEAAPVAVAAAAPSSTVPLADVLYGQQAAAIAAAAPAEEAAEAGEVQLALVAPRPTSRPAFEVVDEIAALPEMSLPVEMAATDAPIAAASASSAAQIIAGVSGESQAVPPSATLAAFLPLPSGRPADSDIMLAALPREAAAARAQTQDKVDERLARLAAAPGTSPRVAIMERDAGVAPEAAIVSGVRTTSKGAKPSAADSRPDPRTVRIPVPQQVARWALSNEPIRMDQRGTTAPSFAHDIVRTAPKVVYTEGFVSADAQSQSNRFTGKAVSFLSVARFSSN